MFTGSAVLVGDRVVARVISEFMSEHLWLPLQCRSVGSCITRCRRRLESGLQWTSESTWPYQSDSETRPRRTPTTSSSAHPCDVKLDPAALPTGNGGPIGHVCTRVSHCGDVDKAALQLLPPMLQTASVCFRDPPLVT